MAEYQQLDCDVLLIIISHLNINDILSLSKVCKPFLTLCRSNYVWGPRFFGGKSEPTEKTLKIIYGDNKPYFGDFFYFKNYVVINYEKGTDTCNYFDLFKNLCTLVPDLRVPYKHEEIINDIRAIYDQMVKEGFNYEEFIYSIRSVEKLPFYLVGEYIWKYQTVTNNCDLMIILRKSKQNLIKMKKYVRPFNIPVNIIKKTKIIMYAETVNKLFKHVDS